LAEFSETQWRKQSAGKNLTGCAGKYSPNRWGSVPPHHHVLVHVLVHSDLLLLRIREFACTSTCTSTGRIQARTQSDQPTSRPGLWHTELGPSPDFAGRCSTSKSAP